MVIATSAPTIGWIYLVGTVLTVIPNDQMLALQDRPTGVYENEGVAVSGPGSFLEAPDYFFFPLPLA